MNWSPIRLKHVCRIVAGGTPSVDDPDSWADADEAGYPWVTIGDMSGSSLVSRTSRRITFSGLRKVRIPLGAAGTILFSMYASLGHTAVLATEAAWNQALLGLSPLGDAEPRFIRYSLIALKPRLSELARSNTQANLNAEQVGNLLLSLPSPHEQRRIADFLDSETTRLDQVSQVRALQIAAMRERLFAKISEALLPGILTRPHGQATWTWLPDLPVDRPMVRLGYVCRLQSGLTVDESRDVTGDVVTRPYLRVANVQAGRIDLSKLSEVTVPRAMAARTTLRVGDVLMTEGGDLDKLGRGTVWRGEVHGCLHQNHVFALRPDPDKLDGDYLALLTQSLHGRCYFESTGVRTTNLSSTSSSKILAFPVPMPTLDVQRTLVAALRAHIEATERALHAFDQHEGLLAERRQSLITAAVKGRLDVTTARPREEN